MHIYSVQFWHVYTIHKTITTIEIRNISITLKSRLLALPSQSPPFPFPSPVTTYCFLSVKTSLLLLEQSVESHSMYALLSGFFAQHSIVRFIHVITFIMSTVHSFLSLTSTPLYGHTICFPSPLLRDIGVFPVWGYHKAAIHIPAQVLALAYAFISLG